MLDYGRPHPPSPTQLQPTPPPPHHPAPPTPPPSHPPNPKHRPQPKKQILLGKRGRGKSTQLALKIQQFAKQNIQPQLLVTTFKAHRQRILQLLPQNPPPPTPPPPMKPAAASPKPNTSS
ncbi:hypothetical protein [Rappaport israeli]|uniref:hypothetical protein n=1 Tax=Rappaport israeli TaxID=1839807 RepID=UPI001E4DB8B2|nr:hypothetical protein [Rappaport israeli]